MKKEDILTKARLNPAYAASEKFLDDLENLGEDFDYDCILQTYDVWAFWHHKLQRLYFVRKGKISPDAESCQIKQCQNMQYYFLNNLFLQRMLRILSKKQTMICFYGNRMLDRDNPSIREALVLQQIMLLLPQYVRTPAAQNFIDRLDAYVEAQKRMYAAQ